MKEEFFVKINAHMQEKPGAFDFDDCHIERVVEVPKVDFFAMSRCPMGRHSVIRQNRDVMGHDEKGIHCLLVLGEGGRDGILVDSEGYDYCRLAAYIPEARTIVEATPELSITRNVPAEEPEQGSAPAMSL